MAGVRWEMRLVTCENPQIYERWEVSSLAVRGSAFSEETPPKYVIN